jgi:sulfite exporter TauE/SafE
MVELLGFFSLGFFGGFGHCIFMCNPFVIYVASKFAPNSPGYVRFFLPQIKYNLGRIITYGSLGLVFGSASSAGELFGNIVYFQKILAIFAGVFLIAYATFDILGLKIISKLENNIITKKISKIISLFSFNSPFLAGLVLGFLPCGLLYGALIGVTSLNNPLKSMISMVLFGVGTSASLLLVSVFGSIVLKHRMLFRIISFLIMIILGIFFIISGIRF